MVPSKPDFQSANIAILELRQAVSRWLERIKQSFLVFWKGLIALPNMNFTDLSPCHVSSLSRADRLFCSDREEKWQKETSVELMSGSALRPFQNTKKFSPIPSSHRNKANWSVKIAVFADGISALNHFEKSRTIFLRAEMSDRLRFFLVKYKNKFPTSLSGLFWSGISSMSVRR